MRPDLWVVKVNGLLYVKDSDYRIWSTDRQEFKLELTSRLADAHKFTSYVFAKNVFELVSKKLGTKAELWQVL